MGSTVFQPNLGNTPQTLTEPVYENYSYRLVDIKVNKKSLTKIGLVDLKDQTLRSDKNLFESGKNFTVAYGLNDADPQKNQIENRHDDEQDGPDEVRLIQKLVIFSG